MSNSIAQELPDWKDTLSHQSKLSAEERLFGSIGNAIQIYAKEKAEEAERWKAAYEMEIKKNAQLVKILKQNGIDVHDYSSGIKIKNKKTKQKNCFSDLVQGDKKLNLKKLHNRIDGHGGKDVAAILLRAKEDAMISRLPTKAEFNSEFSAAIGEWRSISTYLNPNNLVDYSSVRL